MRRAIELCGTRGCTRRVNESGKDIKIIFDAAFERKWRQSAWENLRVIVVRILGFTFMDSIDLFKTKHIKCSSSRSRYFRKKFCIALDLILSLIMIY